MLQFSGGDSALTADGMGNAAKGVEGSGVFYAGMIHAAAAKLFINNELAGADGGAAAHGLALIISLGAGREDIVACYVLVARGRGENAVAEEGAAYHYGLEQIRIFHFVHFVSPYLLKGYVMSASPCILHEGTANSRSFISLVFY